MRRRPARQFSAWVLASVLSFFVSGCRVSERQTESSVSVIQSSSDANTSYAADYFQYTEDGAAGDAADEQAQLECLKNKKRKVTVWTAYWDSSGAARTISRNRNRIDGVSLFAAWYPDGTTLTLSQESRSLAEHLSSIEEVNEIPRFLCIVNDTDDEAKSVSLLQNLLRDTAQQTKTIDGIIEMAKTYHFSGIDLDFENIRDDLDLWEKFCQFASGLQTRCTEEELSFRILLEPRAPVDQINLPSGPEYVVMCYNLCGIGTDPGPKADASFLIRTAEKFEALGQVSYALANGGFEFKDSGEVKAVADTDIPSLIDSWGSEPVRDSASGALYIRSGKNTLWYADARTLEFWADTLDSAAGRTVDINLWKI